jgi:hypothetical protein
MLSVAGLLSLASTAAAIPAPIHISGTAGEGVYIRPSPDTSRPPLGWMPEGASPDYNCFAWGQNVNGVPIWFNVNYGGVTGYYSSFFDDSSYHSNEELTAKYGVPLCGASSPAAPPQAPTPVPPVTPLPPVPAPAPASSAPAPSPSAASPPGGALVFSIVDADGGVYFRNSPSWPDTSRRSGVGVYTGDQVELVCGAFGDAVGPYDNRAWSMVRNLSRPNAGEGWVNEHFVADGAPANALAPGEPVCKSLYYSPYPANPHGPNSTGQIRGDSDDWLFAPSPARVTMNSGDWDRDFDEKGCPRPGALAPVGQAAFDRGQIETLAAWSRSRAIPFVFLHDNRRWQEKIHYILLFDPGSKSEWNTSKCARKYDLSAILRDWLRLDPVNRFVVLSGRRTADAGTRSKDGHGHAGIQDEFFVPLKKLEEKESRALRARIVVCNYDDMSHPDVWRNFSGWMNRRPIELGGCPPDPATGKTPVSWNP